MCVLQIVLSLLLLLVVLLLQLLQLTTNKSRVFMG